MTGHSQARHALIPDRQAKESVREHDDGAGAHDHYHVVIQVYDGSQQIGKTIVHWDVDRADDVQQGQTFTHSQTYSEPTGKTVLLAIRGEAGRQVLG
jgi:hypothetical protein